MLFLLTATRWQMTQTAPTVNSEAVCSNLLIECGHVQALHSGVELAQRTLVSTIFTVEVILLGADEPLGSTARVGRLADGARPGGG